MGWREEALGRAREMAPDNWDGVWRELDGRPGSETVAHHLDGGNQAEVRERWLGGSQMLGNHTKPRQ